MKNRDGSVALHHIRRTYTQLKCVGHYPKFHLNIKKKIGKRSREDVKQSRVFPSTY